MDYAVGPLSFRCRRWRLPRQYSHFRIGVNLDPSLHSYNVYVSFCVFFSFPEFRSGARDQGEATDMAYYELI